MEPVTHFLTGACIGRAGFNRRTAYATLAATLAAEAPDLDVLWRVAGPVVSFQHHRGITHTLLGAPFTAVAVTGFIWLVDRGLRKLPWRRKSQIDPQPMRWLWIWFTALVADLSHIVLDWTNNYGVRPFFPFNPRWYSGDLVFIAEPVLWGLLAIALILPALLGLADREVGARRTRFRGRGWAIFALLGMVALWGWRWSEHSRARNLVDAAQVTPTPALRIAVEPYPINPWRWHAILETETTWQTAEVDTRTGAVLSDSHVDSLLKPTWTPETLSVVQAAKGTRLGQVYLDWSAWPVVRDLGQTAVPGNPEPSVQPSRQWSTVEFSDLRFGYSFIDTGMAGNPNGNLDLLLHRSPLNGYAYILDGHEDAGQFLGRREQK